MKTKKTNNDFAKNLAVEVNIGHISFDDAMRLFGRRAGKHEMRMRHMNYMLNTFDREIKRMSGVYEQRFPSVTIAEVWPL